MPASDGADFECELRAGSECVSADFHRSRAGVCLLAVEGDGPTLDTLCALHDGKWLSETLEDGALFDVEFEIGGEILSLDGCVSDTIHRNSADCECGFESGAVAVGSNTIGVDGLGSSEGGGAEEAAAEAGALFVGPVDELDGAGWATVVLACEMLEDLKPGENAEAAVKPAAVGNRIQMTAEHERAFGGSGQSNPVVPCGVVVMFDGEPAELLLEPCTRAQPDGRPRDALGSVFVRGQRTKLLQMHDDSASIDHGKLGYQTASSISEKEATLSKDSASVGTIDTSAEVGVRHRLAMSLEDDPSWINASFGFLFVS
jgi:hypothetical protein